MATATYLAHKIVMVTAHAQKANANVKLTKYLEVTQVRPSSLVTMDGHAKRSVALDIGRRPPHSLIRTETK
jgi:uncharacterized protein YggU (UPF0235/DUF167 family)